MSRRLFAVFFLTWVSAASIRAGDWPTFRHDNHRSGRTEEVLPAARLGESWAWSSVAPPRPAWAGPAKWDAFHGKVGLSAMRAYDLAFGVIAVGGRVFFGSSVDDAVRCLDARSGEERWRFTAGGPIRIVPTWSDGKVFFGSDDGFVYCLEASNGRLHWKFSPAPGRRGVFHDGRLISFWPCRTGVLVEGGTAHFAASLFPWKESYLCAIDAVTGRPEGEGRYVRLHEKLTFEGAFAASRDCLFTPQGRLWLLPFDRASGERRTDINVGGAGCFVMTTEDGHVLGGAAARDLSLSDANLNKPREKIALHAGAKSMVVVGPKAYLISETAVFGIDRETRKKEWEVPIESCHDLIVAGDTVFVGGRDQVLALAAKDGSSIWRAPVDGKVHGLAVAGGALFATTSEGKIHCFQPGATSIEPSGKEPVAAPQPGEGEKAPEPALLAVGPSVQFNGPRSAVVRWGTDRLCPTVVSWRLDGRTRRFEDLTPRTRHEATLDELRRNEVYRYVIELSAGEEPVRRTREYELDTFFNFSQASPPARPCPFPEEGLSAAYGAAAERILKEGLTRRGLCIIVGCRDGRLAYELALQSELRILCMDADPARVAAVRESLHEAGLYGWRVAVVEVSSLSRLPVPDGSAALAVSESGLFGGPLPGHAEEVHRILSPGGGRAFLGGPDGSLTWFERGEAVPGSGSWSHQYGRADNSAWGGETLGGARSVEDLEVQWFGRPGPRYQPDRNGRKPSPLATNGRLFTQGLHRILALDARSGLALWSVEIPDLIRMNIPRDCSNWCAGEEFLYVAVRDRCWQLDAATGRTTVLHDVIPGPRADWSYDWGYVGLAGDLLVGSSVKRGAAYSGFWGGGNWYDRSGYEKVLSDTLFGIDRKAEASRWKRSVGLIINSTVAIGDGRVFFVETRSDQVRASESRRVAGAELWEDLHLVALDVGSGSRLWERRIQPAPGTVMFSLACGSGKVVLLSSSADGKYHLYTFDRTEGSPGWEASFPWAGGDHGLHMARPVLIEDRLYVSPLSFDVTTGVKTGESVPTGRCGTCSASRDAIFYRGGGNITMWDTDQASATGWERLRPGCWLSVVPACGMLLAPEAGGGCWCSIWLETSVGFAPPAYPTPVFGTEDRTFVLSLSVELLEKRPGGKIHYTLDGTEPTPESPSYSGPFVLRDDTTVKAREYWERGSTEDYAESGVVARRFRREYPAPRFESKARLFADSRTVRISKEDADGTIRYTLDGSEPSGDSRAYEGSFTIKETTTIKAVVCYETGTRSPTAEVTYTKGRSIVHEGKRLTPGLRYEYYEGMWEKLPDLDQLEPVATGTVGEFSLSPRKRGDGFAILYTGFIDIPQAGTYTFHLRSDDGAKLTLGDTLVADNDGVHDARGTKSGKIDLEAGPVPIRLEYFELVWDEALIVEYEGPGLERQPVPDTALFLLPADGE